LPAKATVAIAAATGGCFKCAVKVVDQLINSLFFVRSALLALHRRASSLGRQIRFP